MVGLLSSMHRAKAGYTLDMDTLSWTSLQSITGHMHHSLSHSYLREIYYVQYEDKWVNQFRESWSEQV